MIENNIPKKEKYGIQKIKGRIWTIGLSLFLILANYSCEQKENNSTIKANKPQTEQLDKKDIDKMWEQGINKIDNNNLSEALKIFLKIESLYLETKNYDELRNVYRFIGIIFIRQKNNEKALEYFQKALEITNMYNNKRGIIILHAHIGETQRNLGNDSAAITTFLTGWKIANNIKNPSKKEMEVKAILGTDIARYYLKKENNPDLAKKYRKEAIKLNQETNNIKSTIMIKYDIGDFNLHINNAQEALQYYEEGIKLSQETKDKILEEIGYEKISKRYKKNNNRKEAYQYKELADSLKNKRINEESIQQINELNIKHETEKKEQQIKIQQAEIEKTSEQKKRILWTAIASLIAALGAGSAAVIARKGKKKEQKHKEEILNQKILIEKAHHNIQESIEAGKHVQEKIVLTNPEYIKKLFPESFILFQPKDKVSGDFYRFKETPSGKKLFAAVDCTGHGVPGAFISFTGSKILNEAVEKGLDKPSDILIYLDEKISQLQNNEQDTFAKYTMDIALCAWDKTKRTLEYSGAVNPIYLINNNEKEITITEIKPNKAKIGYRHQGQPNEFKNDCIHLSQPNTLIYLFSDGYQDQFGGPNNKKLKRSEFKKYLEQASKTYFSKENTSITEIKNFLEDKLQKRKGNQEQTDDILIIGIKV